MQSIKVSTCLPFLALAMYVAEGQRECKLTGVDVHIFDGKCLRPASEWTVVKDDDKIRVRCRCRGLTIKTCETCKYADAASTTAPTTSAPGQPEITTNAPGLPEISTSSAPGVPDITTSGAPGVPEITTSSGPGAPEVTTSTPAVPDITTAAPGVPEITTPALPTVPPTSQPQE